MVTQLNPRQERFVQLVKQGIPPFRAYPAAGYQPHESAPYRLCGNVRVKRRLDELTRHIAVKTQVTVQSISEELDQAAALAVKVGQPGAMVQAITTKAKLHGILIERKESGQPGEFQGLKTREELIQAAREELGEELAAVLASKLEQSQELEPDAEQAPVDSAPMPTNEGSGSVN